MDSLKHLYNLTSLHLWRMVRETSHLCFIETATKENWTWTQESWLHIQVYTLIISVILSNFLSFSKPQFSHLQNRDNTTPSTSKVYSKDKQHSAGMCPIAVVIAVVSVLFKYNLKQIHIQVKEKSEPWSWYIGQILQQQTLLKMKIPIKWKSPQASISHMLIIWILLITIEL